MLTLIQIFTSLILSLILVSADSLAVEDPAEMAKRVGVDQHQGAKLDRSLKFADSNGQTRVLGDLFTTGKPSLLVPVYYRCPRMCGLVLNGVTTLLNELDLKLGEEIQVITVSFNPEEGPALAKERADHYIPKLRQQNPDTSAWHFLTGDQTNISSLMQQIGFNYYKDGDDFAHGGAVVVLTADGEISQYFLGIEYPAWHVRLALIEAARGAIGSAFDQVLLFCFRFDHLQGKYTWAVFGLLKLVGAVTILVMGSLLFILWRRDIRSHSIRVKNQGVGTTP